MSLQYIRQHYKVPAKRGDKVLAKTPSGELTYGTIIGASGPHLKVRFFGEDRVCIFHPTDVEYCK